ncbi:unnamed protein product [Oppiella nova]|uniref:Tc1-like transposase DDE domain-containing protein n=1 Tax=Oppiella nova TaxID=334625 RepID=A0A7R9QRW8_9ACAR|nr:unnamed protein product [Oppiella nova]CAG2171687.1 unnamed protein product [Oppiella nova]
MSLSHIAAENEIPFRRFIKLRALGEGMHRLLRKFGFSRATYYRWCQYDDDEIPLLKPSHTGRPRITSVEEDDLIAEVGIENRWDSLDKWRDDERLAASEAIFHASDRTLYRRLNEKGIRKCVAAVKQRLTQMHRERRLSYANDFKDWTFEDWSRVIFIDEFGIDTSDNGKLRVFRYRSERFSFHGIGPIMRVKNFSKEVYVEYLEQHLLYYINEHFEDGNFHLLHDGHRAHTSTYVKEWIFETFGLEYQYIVFPHPACSPDMNPVEHVGGMLKHLVRTYKPQICTADVKVYNNKTDKYLHIEKPKLRAEI